MSLLGSIFGGRPDERVVSLSDKDIRRVADAVVATLKPKLDKIMANTQETVDQIKALGGTITTLGNLASTTLTTVTKSGTEIRTLLDKIKELSDVIANGNVDPAITAALAEVNTQAGVVNQTFTAVRDAAVANDEAVPDAPTPTPSP